MDVSVDHVWSLKEEPCRANNWRNDEVVALLRAIKTHNLMKGSPSSNQLGQLVEPLLGLGRTAFQITGKLKNLRKSYLTCEKKGCTPDALKDCPYYDLLTEVYGNKSVRDPDSKSAIDDAKDESRVSVEQGIQKMFSVMKDLNLAPDFPSRSFPPSAVRLISQMLVSRGVCTSADRVKTALAELGKSCMELRQNCQSDPSDNPHLEHLYALWGSTSQVPGDIKMKEEPEINKDKGDQFEEEDSLLYREKIKHSRSRSWSDDETVLMLTLLKDLNLARLIAHRLSFEIACKLVEPLREQGFSRSAMQIQIKLRNLRKSYYRCVRAGNTEKAISDCPFYERLNAIFRQPRDRKLATVRKLEHLASNFVNLPETFSDHSYSSTAGRMEKVNEPQKTEEKDSEEEHNEMWLPVETICEEFTDDAQEESDPEESIKPSLKNKVELPEDPLRSSTQIKLDNDTGQVPSEQTPQIYPGPSRRPNKPKPRPASSNKDSTLLKCMRLLLSQVLRQGKQLQRQHHVWLERQFELQRKHAEEQRELLFQELRAIRRAISSTKTPLDGFE